MPATTHSHPIEIPFDEIRDRIKVRVTFRVPRSFRLRVWLALLFLRVAAMISPIEWDIDRRDNTSGS